MVAFTRSPHPPLCCVNASWLHWVGTKDGCCRGHGPGGPGPRLRGLRRGFSCFPKLGSFGERGLSKLVISRVIIRVTPFRALITLLITYLLRARDLQLASQLRFRTLALP